MKEMSKSVILAKKSVTSINFEKELLSRLNHPFICNICYAFQDEENLYLVVELSNGGDLRYHLFRNIQFNEIQTSKLKINNNNNNNKIYYIYINYRIYNWLSCISIRIFTYIGNNPQRYKTRKYFILW